MLLLLPAGNRNDRRRASPSSATSRTAACSARCGLELFRRAPMPGLGRRSFASRLRPMSALPNIAIWRMTRMSKSKHAAAPSPS